MPSVPTEPANGAAISASAQVLNSKNVIIGDPLTDGADWGMFAAEGGAAGGAILRDLVMFTPVNNLEGIYINAYQYPEYDRGDTPAPFLARVNIEWRVVFMNPPDLKPLLAGFVAFGNGPYGWIPATSPMLLLPGIPVVYRVCCAGFSFVSIEVRAGVPAVGQGQDRVAFSISASQ